MGRRSEAESLLQPMEASEAARERVKVMLLTLAGQWSVKDGLDWLGLSRTRFQVLRGRMLEGALAALEPGAAGRPRSEPTPEDERVCALRLEVKALRYELQLVRASLEIAEGPAAEAVRRRLLQRLDSQNRRTR